MLNLLFTSQKLPKVRQNVNQKFDNFLHKNFRLKNLSFTKNFSRQVICEKNQIIGLMEKAKNQ